MSEDCCEETGELLSPLLSFLSWSFPLPAGFDFDASVTWSGLALGKQSSTQSPHWTLRAVYSVTL